MTRRQPYYENSHNSDASQNENGNDADVRILNTTNESMTGQLNRPKTRIAERDTALM